MKFSEWLNIGLDKKWISNIHCETHEGTQMTKEELDAWDEGQDPCIPIIRVWE
jgi:hypothetical protein